MCIIYINFGFCYNLNALQAMLVFSSCQKNFNVFKYPIPYLICVFDIYSSLKNLVCVGNCYIN